MGKVNYNSRNNYLTTVGIVDVHDSKLDQPVLRTSDVIFNSVTTTEGMKVGGDLVVDGNLTVSGGTTVIDTDVLKVQDNIIEINTAETGAGVTPNLSGIEVDRGSLPNFQIVFEESTDLLKIGFVGDLQAVATREDNPLADGVMTYNEPLGRLDSVTDIKLPITFSSNTTSSSSSTGTVIVKGGVGVSGNIFIDGRYYLHGSNYTNNISATPLNETIIRSGSNFSFDQDPGTFIHVPPSVSLTFAANDKSIYSDNVDLYIGNASGNIVLNTVINGHISIPVGTYLQWNTLNKLRHDGANIVLSGDTNFVIYPILRSLNTTPSINPTTGSIITIGGIGINNSTDAVSSRNGGTLTSAGGAGITKTLIVGNKIVVGDLPINTTQVFGEGVNFRSINKTLTTTSSNNVVFNSFEGGTVSTAATITSATTVYISSAPTATGVGTVTNTYALWVASGKSKFDGGIEYSGTTPSTSPITGVITLGGGIGINNPTNSVSPDNGGTFTTAGGVGIKKDTYVGGKIEVGVEDFTGVQTPRQGITFRSRQKTLITGSTNDAVFNSFEGGLITSSATIATASTVFIGSSPVVSGGGIVTNSYSLFVETGISRFNGITIFGNTTPSSDATVGSTVYSGGISISNTTDATSVVSGGTFTTAGGMSIAKSLFVGSSVSTNGGLRDDHYTLSSTELKRFSIGLASPESGSNSGSNLVIARYEDDGTTFLHAMVINRSSGDVVFHSATDSTSPSVGALRLSGGLSISSITDAASAVSGGSFTTAGGAAIGQSLFVGKNVEITGDLTVLGITVLSAININTDIAPFNVAGANGMIVNTGATNSITSTSGDIVLVSETGIVSITGFAGVVVDSDSSVNISAGANSSFTTTAGDLNFESSTGNTTIVTGAKFSISSGTGGIEMITSDTASGVKIATEIPSVPVSIGNASSETTIGGNLTVGGDIDILGTTTVINSDVVLVGENAIVVNNTPSGISDGGYLIHRWQLPNDANEGAVVEDVPLESNSFGAGSALPATLILNPNSSPVNEYYTGWWIKITSGNGIDQVRRILTYDGTDKIATIYLPADDSRDGMILTTVPDAGDFYSLYNAPYVSMYFQEELNEFRFAGVPFDISSGTFQQALTYYPIHCKNIVSEGGTSIGGDTDITGTLTVNVYDPTAFNVQNGSAVNVFSVDTVNGDSTFTNPTSTIGSDITLLFKHHDLLSALQTYSRMRSVIVANTPGSLRSNLTYSVQSAAKGLVEFMALRGGTLGYIDFSTNVDSVRVLNTTASTSPITGALLVSGGIGISNTTDAVSAANGGSITSAGGVGITKSLYVGGRSVLESILTVPPNSNTYTMASGAVNISGDVVMSNTSGPQILAFAQGTLGAPSSGTRSIGTKIVVFPSISPSTCEAAIGMETGAMWYSVGDTLSAHHFYVGDTIEASIDNSGININVLGDSLNFLDSGAVASNIYTTSDTLMIRATNTEFRDPTDTESYVRISSDGQLSIGLSPVEISPTLSGALLNVARTELVDTNTAALGINQYAVFSSFAQSTLSALNPNVTTVQTANVFIEGCPFQGTDQTFQNTYGLFIGGGSPLNSINPIGIAASLFIQNSPQGNNITNAYSFYVEDGLSRIDGRLLINNSTKIPDDNNNFTTSDGAIEINGDIILVNDVSQAIAFADAGAEAPAVAVRSLGTKIVLNPQISVSTCDFALGIEQDAMWYSVPSVLQAHKFYTGTVAPVSIIETGIKMFTANTGGYSTITTDTVNDTDDTGIIISGGGDIDNTRGATLTLSGNENNSGNAELRSGGPSGEINLSTGDPTEQRVTILPTGQVLVKFDENTTSNTTGALQVAGGISAVKSILTSESLILDFNQAYVFSGNSTGHLNVQSTFDGSPHRFKHYTSLGDNSTDNSVDIFGMGTPILTANQEFLRMGFDTLSTRYIIKSNFTGTGVARSINIEAGNNTGQLQINTDGTVTINSYVVSTSPTVGALKLSGGIAIDNTTNATNVMSGGSFTTAGGMAVGRDLYIGGKLVVEGPIDIGVTIPNIIIGTTSNINGVVDVYTNKAITNGSEKFTSFICRATPLVASTVASFEFVVPDRITNFANAYEIVMVCSGYTDDIDPVNLENIIGFAIAGTVNAKIKFTSGSLAINTIQIILRYTAQ